MLPFVISLERGKNSDTMGKGLLSSGNINSDFRIKFFFFPLLSPLSRKIPFFIEISLKKKKMSQSEHSFISKKETVLRDTKFHMKFNEIDSEPLKIDSKNFPSFLTIYKLYHIIDLLLKKRN